MFLEACLRTHRLAGTRLGNTNFRLYFKVLKGIAHRDLISLECSWKSEADPTHAYAYIRKQWASA